MHDHGYPVRAVHFRAPVRNPAPQMKRQEPRCARPPLKRLTPWEVERSRGGLGSVTERVVR